jgi:hypothetical protein
MKNASLFCCLLLLASCRTQLDTEISLFDEFQTTRASFQVKTQDVWSRIDPEASRFLTEWFRMDAAYRRLQRMVFLYQLEKSPQAIDWGNPYGWGGVVVADSLYETYSSAIPSFQKTLAEYKELKGMVAADDAALKKRNTLYGDHKKEFAPLEMEEHEAYMRLQKRMDKVRENRPNQVPEDTARKLADPQH